MPESGNRLTEFCPMGISAEKQESFSLGDGVIVKVR
jgi:hypothetical protein